MGRMTLHGRDVTSRPASRDSGEGRLGPDIPVVQSKWETSYCVSKEVTNHINHDVRKKD